jgi:flagellar biosynthesis/type III secretory pathway chaperone
MAGLADGRASNLIVDGRFIAVESLSELLVRELSDLRRFCALLAEERKILSGAEADRLADIANEKSSLAAQLNQIEARRDALLVKDGFPKGRSGTEAWLAGHPNADTERRQWNEVLTLAAQARDENETNGRLINLLLKQNQEALSLLLSGGTDSIYGVDGQQRSLADGKRSFGTV